MITFRSSAGGLTAGFASQFGLHKRLNNSLFGESDPKIGLPTTNIMVSDKSDNGERNVMIRLVGNDTNTTVLDML